MICPSKYLEFHHQDLGHVGEIHTLGISTPGVGPENGAAPRPNPERTSPANAQAESLVFWATGFPKSGSTLLVGGLEPLSIHGIV